MSAATDRDLGQGSATPQARPAGPARWAPFVSLLIGLPAVLFALITWQVVDRGPLLGVDRDVSHALLHPDRASELLADLGNVGVAVPALAVVLAYAALRGRATGVDRWWAPPLAAAALMVVLPALVVPLKEWTGRHGTTAVPPGVGFFPSGHTATAMIAYGSGTLVLLPLLRTALARLAVVAVCCALVLAVSFGLVRRGYHWPLDVAASWCLGAVLLSLLYLFVAFLSRSTRRSSSRTPSSRTGPS